MNKNLYRLIYSKARGMLIAVAEFTRSQRAGTAVSSSGKRSAKLICKLSSISFGVLLATGAVQTVQAAIVADANVAAGLQPTIINNPGMATQVDIQAPSAGGVSRNVYSQFDVDRNGVILNNSQHGAFTQNGGMVAGNASLAQGAAKIILNEVNSSNPSQLNGLIEVAGQNAQVVIANPSGITCNGCGFINANRATLTTGQVQMKDGVLTGYRVEGGEVVVEGDTVWGNDQDYTDIIARSVKINTKMYANDLKITTGLNNVDATNTKITRLDNAGSGKAPELSLDVSSLGGMYAGKITLVGTEKGVGVSNAGQIIAGDALTVLNENGDIRNTGYVHGGNKLLLTGSNIHNDGTLFAKENIAIDSSGKVTNSGEIYTHNFDSDYSEITIKAASLESSGGIGATQGWPGTGNITIDTKGDLIATGFTHADGNLTMQGKTIDLNRSVTQANNIKLIASEGIINTSNAQVRAIEQLAITGSEVINRQGSLFGGEISVVTGDIDNLHGTIDSRGKLKLKGNSLTNTGGLLMAGDSLEFIGKEVNNQGGQLYTEMGDISLDVTGDILNTDSGKITTYGKLLINAGGNITNSGQIFSGAQLVINAKDINNNDELLANDSIELNSEGAITNNGKIETGGDIKIAAATLNSRGTIFANGSISGAGNLSIRTTGDLIATGRNHAIGDLTMQGQALDLSGSDTYARNITLVASDELKTSNARVVAEQQLKASGKKIDNKDGLLEAENIALTADSLDNQAGSIRAASELALAVTDLKNEEGFVIVAGKDLFPKKKDPGDISFSEWDANGDVYREITSIIGPRFFEGYMLTDILQYLYGILVSGGEIDSDVFQSIVTTVSGGRPTEAYESAVDTVVRVLTAKWSSQSAPAVPDVMPPANEIVDEDKGIADEIVDEDKGIADEIVDEDKGIADEIVDEDKGIADEIVDEDKGIADEIVDEDKGIADDKVPSFSEWDTNGDVYREITSVIGRRFFEGNTLSDMLSHLYGILVSGGEIDSDVIQSIVTTVSGGRPTEAYESAVNTVVRVLTEKWSSQSAPVVPDVTPPANEIVDEDKGIADEIVDEDKGIADEIVDEDKGIADEIVDEDKGIADEIVDEDKGIADEIVDEDKGIADEIVDEDKGIADEIVDEDKGIADEIVDEDKGIADEIVDEDKGIADEIVDEDKGIADEIVDEDKGIADEIVDEDKGIADEIVDEDKGIADDKVPSFSEWDTNGDVYREITSIIGQKFFQGYMLSDMLSHLYGILASGGEIDSDVIQSIVTTVSGMGPTEANESAVNTVVRVLTERWSGQSAPAVPDVTPPADEIVDEDKGEWYIPPMDIDGHKALEQWPQSALTIQQIKTAITNGDIKWQNTSKEFVADVVNYFTWTLAKGGEINEQLIHAIAAQVWGMDVTAENDASIASIANIVTANWLAR